MQAISRISTCGDDEPRDEVKKLALNMTVCIVNMDGAIQAYSKIRRRTALRKGP